MRRLAVSVLNYSHIICGETGINLSTHNQWRQIVAAKTIYQGPSIWSVHKRTIQTHIDWSHAVPRKTAAAIRYRDGHLSWKIIRATAVIGSYGAEIESSLARQEQWRVRSQ